MKRMHRYIAGIILIEKEERKKKQTADKVTMGYDPTKWLKSNGAIRSENQEALTYHKLIMPPAVTGRHRFGFCQQLYEHVHSFLRQREWAHAHQESSAGGITWTELFILFDQQAERPEKAHHQKNPKAFQRARRRKIDARNAKEKKASKSQIDKRRNQTDDPLQSSVVSKPSLAEELQLFKAIIRHITKHELGASQKDWFSMEQRSHFRRLAPLGIEGNQAALACFCKLDSDEEEAISTAIIQQKMGANPKAIRTHKDLRADQGSQEKALYKKTRIAMGVPARWKRRIAYGNHADDDPEDRGDFADTVRGDAQEGDELTYTSRLLACKGCGHQQETKWMQLRTKEGYRAIHCPACHKQQRSQSNHCQCGVIWHHCAVHRVDPAAHRSRRAPKKTEIEKKASDREVDSRSKKAKTAVAIEKPPPEVDDEDPIRHKKGARKTAGKGKQRGHTLKLARGLQSMYPPKEGLIERLRERLKKKTEEPRQDQNESQSDEGQQERKRKLDEASTVTGLASKRRRIAKDDFNDKQADGGATILKERSRKNEGGGSRAREKEAIHRILRNQDKGKTAQNERVQAERAQSDPQSDAADGAEDERQEEKKRKQATEASEAAGNESPIKAHATQEDEQEEPDTDDEFIEACWQDLLKDESMYKISDSTDEELIEDDAVYDHDPQLPGSSSQTEAIKARLKQEAKGKQRGASSEDGQCEAKRQKIARSLRIQNANGEGKHSEKFDGRIRCGTIAPATKLQRGNAGRIRRDEVHAIKRILYPCTATSSSCAIGSMNLDGCSSEEGPGSLSRRPPA